MAPFGTNNLMAEGLVWQASKLALAVLRARTARASILTLAGMWGATSPPR